MEGGNGGQPLFDRTKVFKKRLKSQDRTRPLFSAGTLITLRRDRLTPVPPPIILFKETLEMLYLDCLPARYSSRYF